MTTRNRVIPNIDMKRDKAARFLVAWLRGVGASFRDHVACQRKALCEDCATREQFVHMRESDALALADRLDSVVAVIRALAAECAGEARAADKLERYDEQDDGADEWGAWWNRCGGEA